MALPGFAPVADEFKALPRDAKDSLALRIYQKRNSDQSNNPNQAQPRIPDWLQQQSPAFEQDSGGRSNAQFQMGAVKGLGETANAATNDVSLLRQQQAQLARIKKQQSLITEMGSGDFSSIPMTNAKGKRAGVINAAKRLIGTPYSWGGGHGGTAGPSFGIAQGRGTKGVDCSGLVRYAFSKAGIGGWGKSAVAATQSMYGKAASIGSLLPGDLVVKGGRGSAHHIAIYIGGGRILEAQRTGTRVHIRSIKGQSGWTGIHLSY